MNPKDFDAPLIIFWIILCGFICLGCFWKFSFSDEIWFIRLPVGLVCAFIVYAGIAKLKGERKP